MRIFTISMFYGFTFRLCPSGQPRGSGRFKHPNCADVSVRLPDALGENEIRYTNAQATAAWG